MRTAKGVSRLSRISDCISVFFRMLNYKQFAITQLYCVIWDKSQSLLSLASNLLEPMNVIEAINASDKTLFSFEILPPLKGNSIKSINEAIDPLLEYKPKFINVTYHREEFVYKKRDKGFLEKVSIRKRPGTVGICAAIKYKYGIETIPHLTCGGFSRQETEDALIDLHFLGIDNILALRGDPIKTENLFVPEKNGNHYAVELVEQIMRMNKGEYMDEEIQNAEATQFCVGVAGYPEKHYEAMSLKADIKNLKKKIDAGASYIVTQMFFDNKKFFAFEKKCREEGINVPIIPGLKPITMQRHIEFIPKTFYIDFPEELSDEFEKCKNPQDYKQVGIEWCIKQSKELMKAGVPCLHYYTMGKSDAVRGIVEKVF
jgi:methylenetetrahydrofolate reductase (NADPH)